MTLAWHFVGDTLRDGRPIPADGEWLEHDGDLIMCETGLHASKRLIDALNYAPGSTICRVRIGGTIETQGHTDKLVASKRKILWRVDGSDLLRQFARECALDVIHLWDAPETVVQFLRSGDENLRDAARDAVRDAASDAAWDVAWDAVRAAARDVAWAAASDAVRAAARDAAWDAVRAAARDAVRAAARDAARDAAWHASWDAASAAQNKKLTAMVMAAHREGDGS